MSSARYIVGDVRDVMASMPDASVDLLLTSPPFLALRSYLPADHPDKAREIGSEPTPAAFLDTLLALTAEWRRLLTPHGSLCVELGDTFADSGGPGGDYNAGGLREGQPKWERPGKRHEGNPGIAGRAGDGMGRPRPVGPGWPMAKSLCMVPELYRVALAYGINPLTGSPSPAGRWRVRNVVRWCRPNPPVGALGDKFRPATTDMVVACTDRRRWFDLDAVREAHKNPESLDPSWGGVNRVSANGRYRAGETVASNPAGAPPLDWWNIPTEPYPGSHYATWPRDLCVRPIKAMCPTFVCTICGEPRRRILSDAEYVALRQPFPVSGRAPFGAATGRSDVEGLSAGKVPAAKVAQTVGWSECACPCCENGDECGAKWRPGIVLDPFAGSGTTLAVATGLGRDAIGIDLDARNAELAYERVGGLFLTVEHHAAEGVA